MSSVLTRAEKNRRLEQVVSLERAADRAESVLADR